jgi:hypothetical protein
VVARQAKLAVFDRPVSVVEEGLPTEGPRVEAILEEHAGVVVGASRETHRKRENDDRRADEDTPAASEAAVEIA